MPIDKLLPCPFCGGEALKVDDYDDIDQPSFIECQGCFVVTAPFYNGYPTKPWNPRATTKREEKLREALKEIIKGEGAYSKDAHTFAVNVIENIKKTAKQALQQTEEQGQ